MNPIFIFLISGVILVAGLVAAYKKAMK